MLLSYIGFRRTDCTADIFPHEDDILRGNDAFYVLVCGTFTSSSGAS
jgi:hypothetical protein